MAVPRPGAFAREAHVTALDRALAALIAAFVPARAAELSAYLDPRRGAGVRAAAEALVRAGRSARLHELARSLGPPQLPRAPAAGSERAVARPMPGGGRLRERLILESAAAPASAARPPGARSGRGRPASRA
jgi:hypothetical protein